MMVQMTELGRKRGNCRSEVLKDERGQGQWAGGGESLGGCPQYQSQGVGAGAVEST